MKNITFSTLGCHSLPLTEIIKIAVKNEIDTLELRGLSGKMSILEIPEFQFENIYTTKKLLSDAGVSVCVIGCSSKFDDPETLFGNILHAKYAGRIAYALGAKYIRVFGNKIRSEETLENVIAALGHLADYFKKYDITPLLEVHGDFNTHETLLPICKALDGRNFGLVYDVAHADRTCGNDFEPFIEPLIPYIKHVHIKDHKRTSPPTLCSLGDGDIPFLSIANHLESKGYDGYFSLEWERAWHPELSDIEGELNNFRKQALYK